MDVRAAVAVEARKPLEVTTVQLEGPKAFEVLVEVKATGICHTDWFTLSGDDPEGLFPAILGHEGAGIVREVGAGVTTPIISQWPVMVSFPGPSGCRRPCSTGEWDGGTPATGMIEPSPSAPSVGRSKPPAASATCWSVLAPASP